MQLGEIGLAKVDHKLTIFALKRFRGEKRWMLSQLSEIRRRGEAQM